MIKAEVKTKSTLIIDSHYLCYRSMFTIGDLSYEDKGTGVIFGFLNQLLQLATKFNYPKFIFAWDSKKSYRRDIYPQYKKKDKEHTQDMIELLGIAKPQFQTLRTQVLPRMGFMNNFIQTGLEADDIIAMKVYYSNSEFIIVSSDNDLYQLLSHRVKLYDIRKKKDYTINDFGKEFGFDLSNFDSSIWNDVKILAGCGGDNIDGIKGVGIPTAIKYLTGRLTGKKWELIHNERGDIDKINRPLIELPHHLTKPITLQKDRFNFPEFEVMCQDYGFRSFLKKGVYEKWKKILA